MRLSATAGITEIARGRWNGVGPPAIHASMSNSTLIKFGYPDTLIRRYEHWCVLLRPAQVTLGSLVLAALGEARAFSQIPPHAFAELATVTRHIEQGLRAFKPYDKINYLM